MSTKGERALIHCSQPNPQCELPETFRDECVVKFKAAEMDFASPVADLLEEYGSELPDAQLPSPQTGVNRLEAFKPASHINVFYDNSLRTQLRERMGSNAEIGALYEQLVKDVIAPHVFEEMKCSCPRVLMYQVCD